MANIKLRQVTSATDPGSTSAKGSALTHVEMDSNLILINTEVGTKIASVVADTSPQLGGALDVNGQNITSASSGNIVLDPNGTGAIQLNSNVTVQDGTHDFDIASHDGSNGLKLGGTLVTATAANLNLVTGKSAVLGNVLEDTTPQLGGDLDLNGKSVNDASRLFQIYGNEDNVSTLSGFFDSINGSGSRVHGPVTVKTQVNNSSDRFHSNPILSYYQANAATSSGGTSAGRIRMNYVEGVYDMNGHNNSTSGFGQGFNGHFVSTFVQNKASGNDAATLAAMTGATYTPQFESTASGGLTVTDCRAINMQPNVNGSTGAVTLTNLYGLYYDTVVQSSTTVTNHYSFYGNDETATNYNAGGHELPSYTVAQLQSTSPVNAVRRTGNMVFCTNETGGSIPCFWDGSVWKRVSDRATISA